MQPSDPAAEQAYSEGFHGIRLAELEAMNDVDLAAWQAGWAPSTAKFILAEREWARRLAKRQLLSHFELEEKVAAANRRWGIGAALIGVVGTLAGAALGLLWSRPAANATSPAPAGASAPASTPVKGHATPGSQATASQPPAAHQPPATGASR